MESLKRRSRGSHGAGKGYSPFFRIDGRHPFRTAVPGAFVDYRARARHDCEVFYFNFDLAKEIGLIPQNHPPALNSKLSRSILKTFALQIINEYDLLHRRNGFLEKNILPFPYMATRYLQLQHPDRRGRTSGDGRSVWSGFFYGGNGIWDIQSCGTGATCLSPATALANKYFRTGDPSISYGCGRADLLDGVSAAIMSEIFHYNDIATERVLAVISCGDGTAINVRAARNLLRPAHFFRFLKLNDYEGLKKITDYYLEREFMNGGAPRREGSSANYRAMLNGLATRFAHAAAVFESEYIFCWLDWDGDNILMNGGILDYGSVRQFGLFHHEYRYDDDQRMSTSIREQKAKAKYIVQTFAQAVDFLIRRKKRNIAAFRWHPALNLFEREFERKKDEILLYKMGFTPPLVRKMQRSKSGAQEVRRFRRLYFYFEQVKSKRGRYKTEDGITWDAVFCLRDIMRELPALYLKRGSAISAPEFLEILKSRYASRRDSVLTPARKRKITAFQRLYGKILARASRIAGQKPSALLKEMTARSALINHEDRITGDSIIYVARKMIRGRKSMDSRTLHKLFSIFVRAQILRPEYFDRHGSPGHYRLENEKARRIFASMLQAVRENRDGI